jgi:polysaccharide biosynthesis/export protein
MKLFRWILLILPIILNSCGNYKRFTYLQPDGPEINDTIYQQNLIFYKLQPADILYVKVLSIDKTVTELFIRDASSNSASMTGGGNNAGMYITGYSIDKDGNITLPIIGKIQVAGLTIEETKQKIQNQATSYITDAQVEVKLLSFKVSLLGEVSNPGQYNIYNDKANVFEAIAQAGDLTYNGNRKRVLIVRSINNNTKTIRVDLTTRKILSSDQYYLQPNDIIYVEPLKTTVFRLRVSDYSILLTLITSSISVMLLINQALKK